MTKDNRYEEIYNFILDTIRRQKKNNQAIGVTTKEVADGIGIKRTNASSELNRLVRDGLIKKCEGRPVVYTCIEKNQYINNKEKADAFNNFIGFEGSLKKPIKQAKAAISYPPRGLHTLLLGPTGVGKTMFAEKMYEYAIEKGQLSKEAPFVTLNCADYSNNPQILLSQLFGYVKGAFTGANKDYSGLVESADKGILFLDEVHRLPPEGQETLFYLMDKGVFSPIGSIEKKHVDVLIICATTARKEDSLLDTFTRRIPMSINIPSLKERNKKERFKIAQAFIEEEASRIKKEIVVNVAVIKNLLNYECLGNIGQLKSDIKLICANAFLDAIHLNRDKVEIEVIHLPDHIRKYGIYEKDFENEMKSILGKSDFLTFSCNGECRISTPKNKIKYESFYDKIEKRLKDLSSRYDNQDDIDTIIRFEINGQFKSYIEGVNNNIELEKVVSKKSIMYIETLLALAEKELSKKFSKKVFYGLCMHFDSSIKRLGENKTVVNKNLLNVIENHHREFELVRNFIKGIEGELEVRVPLDEIAFIAMFLCIDTIESNLKNKLPRVIISMHGRSSASSMAETVNSLLGIDTVQAYDMELNKDSRTCYEELKELVRKNSNEAGVLLLVDMGSLIMFGDLIAEELLIKIRVIDCVTTITALEVARHAEFERNIDIIYDSILNKQKMTLMDNRYKDASNTKKENIIITACTTGEGSAQKIKKLIEDNINLLGTNTEIVTAAITSHENINNIIGKLSKDKNIIAVVGSIDPMIYGVPFISITDLIMLNKYCELEKMIKATQVGKRAETDEDLSIISEQVFNKLIDKINGIDIETFKKEFEFFKIWIESELSYQFDKDTLIAIVFHLLATTENLALNKKCKEYKNKEYLLIYYEKEIRQIKYALKNIEDKFNIQFKLDELCYLLTILYKL
ncbi:sigma 54-interacting transcriptional regulator [Clostridium sp.]|uniref:sigma-54-dependent transcriptional regulator n=1 Tax=Clostridium sp. TaxID=1506 RepID=UPI0025BC2AE0|nr:sigma 54-interacting transcriptional regulator [Clostridium sp.]